MTQPTQRWSDTAPAGACKGAVLVVEDDQALGDLVFAALDEEGYAVSLLREVRKESVQAAVERLEPDCILLDSEGRTGYGQSWRDATWAHDRARRVPVVMFTTNAHATAEAMANQTERSRQAAFFGVLAKPFRLEDLLDVVARAVVEARHGDHTGQAVHDVSENPQIQRAVYAPDTTEVQEVPEVHVVPEVQEVPEMKDAPEMGRPAAGLITQRRERQRRAHLERLLREVTAVQQALRSAKATVEALAEAERHRPLTPKERAHRCAVALQMEAQRLRLGEVRRELADSLGGA